MTSSYKKSGVGGGAYYTDCMTGEVSCSKTADDYYSSSGKEPPGTWYVGRKQDGSRASNLGLIDGEIFSSTKDRNDVERFAKLINGLHPDNDEKLVQNAGKENRIALHDFTLSVPKSISVIWSQADEPLKKAIEAAQDKGVRTFLDFMSSKSYTRTGKEGVKKEPTPLIGSLFNHGSSRENDPQLHKHCVIFNICERSDGKTGALETKEMMRWQGAATSLYHSNLAWEIRKLGFGIEKKVNLFDVDGVPEDVCLAFSTRRQKIVKAVEKKLKELGMDPDARLASRGMFQAATIETRNQKSELTREQLIKIWHERGAALGFTEKEVTALMSEAPAAELSDEKLREEARLAVLEITENNAIFKEAALVTKIAVRLVGRASSKQILNAVEMVKEKDLLSTYSNRRTSNEGLSEKQIIEAEDSKELVFTTREMLVLERQMLKLADRNDGKHVLGEVTLPANLDPEQRIAALRATQDLNAVSVIEDAAGAGKTFAVAAISRAYEATGYEISGLASSWAAALNLKEVAGLKNGHAITGWLKSVETGKLSLNEKSLIVLDEAGMIGSSDMHHILELCEKSGAKVILLGDRLQQKSVAAGDPLRLIAQQNGTSRLDVVRRQNNQKERDAVNMFFVGQAKAGLDIYAKKLHLHANEDETNKAIIKSWQSSRLSHQGKTHLLLAIDKKSVHELNLLAHEARKAAGELGESVQVKTMDCKGDERVELSVNDRIVFRTNDKTQGVFNRVEGMIEQIKGDKLYVRTKDDALVEVDTGIDKWQHKDGGLALQHAYAMTVFSSQGLTVDRVIVKDALGVFRASAGVAMSRHRDHCEIHVDKLARYQSKMAGLAADQWHPFGEFEDAECIARMGTAWSSEREKKSTLDFESWQSLGARVDSKKEVEIQARVHQKNHLTEQKNAVLQKLSMAERLKRATQESAAIETDFALPAERLLRATTGQIIVNNPLPFQLAKSYELPTPAPSRQSVGSGIERLREQDIDDSVLAEVERQRFMSFDSAGQPVFLGRRPDDSALVLTLQGSPGQEPTPPPQALRHRFPPILHGSPDQLDIVRTGEDALALWSMQERNEEPRSTVIVSGGREEALSLPHVQSLIEKAQTVQRYDLSQGNGELAEINKNAAQEAAARALELEQQQEAYR